MTDALLQFLIMLIGALVPLWLRAVRFAGWKKFTFQVFFEENSPRIILAIVGVLMFSVLSRIDQEGIRQILTMVGLSHVSMGTSGVIGVAIGTLCFIKKRKE